jgi:hypothetical protein
MIRTGRQPFTWTPGTFVAYYPDEPGHDVIDTGMQLITRCGRRVTYLGVMPDPDIWVPVDHLGCFDCRPSPLIGWTAS